MTYQEQFALDPMAQHITKHLMQVPPKHREKLRDELTALCAVMHNDGLPVTEMPLPIIHPQD